MEIFKVIHMEELRSRMASVYPAYKDGEVIYFTENDIQERDGENPSNYGLIPLNLRFGNSATLDPNGGNILSFTMVQRMFCFFIEYKHMLSGGNCNASYTSATAFYDGEASANGEAPIHRFDADLPYGEDRRTYEEMDELYDEYGGDGFYNWLSAHVFPSFEIPMEYRDVWKAERLYVPDAREWIGWFTNMKAKYGTNPTCSSSTNCCECERYVALGGSAMLENLKIWYNAVQRYISENKDIISRDINKDRKLEIDINSGESDVSGFVETKEGSLFILRNLETENIAELKLYVNNERIKTDEFGDGYRISGKKTIKAEIVKINKYKSSKVTLYDTSVGFTPSLLIQHRLRSSVFDLGNESILYEEYDPNSSYYSGNVISVNDESKILSGVISGGTLFNNTYKEKSPDNEHWKDYLGSKDTNGNFVDGYAKAYEGYLNGSTYTISGKTSSRLLDLRSTELLVDDIGNTLEGTYDVSNAKNHQPSENEVLDLMYKQWNTANVTRFKDGIIGDIITKMDFFDSNGESISDPKTYSGGDVMFCDVEYCIGATLDIDNEGKHFKIKNGFNSGVTYNERVAFVKTRREFNLKAQNVERTPMRETTPREHSLSYPIYVWELKQGTEFIQGGSYPPYSQTMASFSTKVKASGTTNDMSKLNNTNSYPTFREEYNIGTSSFQNVDADIYIDRGVSSAFELHSRLSEVHSLDSLLKYNNGFFAIMEN